jgi:hypothetical protein
MTVCAEKLFPGGKIGDEGVGQGEKRGSDRECGRECLRAEECCEECCSVRDFCAQPNNRKQTGKVVARDRLARKPKLRMRTKPWGSRPENQPSNSPSEMQRAVSSVVVNLPGREPAVVCQEANLVFGQAVLIYAIDEFSVALGWPIDRRTMHFQRLDDRRNVGRFWPNHELFLLHERYHCLQGMKPQNAAGQVFRKRR